MGGKKWSEKEIDYLNSMWGRYNLNVLAKKLNRTVEAVKLKSERLGLGGGLKAQDAITKADIKRIDRTSYGVQNKLIRLGYKNRINLAWRNEEINILKKLIEEGYSDYQISEEIGRPRGSVYTKRKTLILDDIKVTERG